MRRLHLVLAMVSCILILTSCASTKETYQRGWIGGKYIKADTSFIDEYCYNYFKPNQNFSCGEGVIPALPNDVRREQRSAVLVTGVYDDTPIRKAGIREGDLIVRINGKKVENIEQMRKIVDETKPGTKINFSVYRHGSIIDLPVVVGKETYQKWYTFSFGLGLGTQFDISSSGINVFNIVRLEKSDARLELHSPEYQYYRSVSPPKHHPDLKVSGEGWDVWLGILGFSGHDVILSQKNVRS